MQRTGITSASTTVTTPRTPIGQRPSARSARRGRRGMTIVEIMMAVAILSIGLGGGAIALIGAISLQRHVRERATAFEAAASTMDALQGEAFAEVFARFNATNADNPAAGNSPGANFAVPGLEAQPGDPDGLAGEILFPGDGTALRENVADAELGMPRDLNADAQIDALDHAADYKVLPVRVRVRWRGAKGNAEFVLGTTLNNERKVP
jgi:prepilin-type N-terminal cleavage/methylation domain-containing protein